MADIAQSYGRVDVFADIRVKKGDIINNLIGLEWKLRRQNIQVFKVSPDL